MKLLYVLLVGCAVCSFNACEKQPYSKTKSMIAEHGEAKDIKKIEPAR